MRFDDEHAYNQKIYDTELIEIHLLEEQRYHTFISKLVKKHSNITGAYWIIDVVCSLNPTEFPEERKLALKRLTLKMYTSYDIAPDNRILVPVLKKTGYSVCQIAKRLNISRNSVYYFLKKEYVTPTRCMFTYGEYNLMLDFMDAWQELTQMSAI